MTLRFLAAAAPRTNGLALSNVDPNATPAAPRRKSRRVRPRCLRDISGEGYDWTVIVFIWPNRRIADFGSFLVEFSHVLRPKALIDCKFLLCAILLPGVHIVLAEAVMGVGKIGIQFQRSLVLGDGLRVLMLVGVEIAQLHMRFGHRGVERYHFLQQRLDLAQVEARVLCPLSLPQTHRVIVNWPAHWWAAVQQNDGISG